jgi:predicted transcriptional regulator
MPATVKPDDQLEGCMAMMAGRGFRHLPVLNADKVVGEETASHRLKQMF